MIEVEKKVVVTPQLSDHLNQHALFLGEISIHDTYFDTPDCRFTAQNIWLRKRDKTFELKRAIKGKDRTVDRYEEILELDEIGAILGLDKKSPFSKGLQTAQIVPFVSFTTYRRKYSLDPFTVDLDLADFGTFTYPIAEIERLVEDEALIIQAEQEILSLLKTCAIDPTLKPSAKLTVYLQKERPHHFSILKKAGVI